MNTNRRFVFLLLCAAVYAAALAGCRALSGFVSIYRLLDTAAVRAAVSCAALAVSV